MVARWRGTNRSGDKKNPVTAGGEPVTGLKRATGVSPGAHVLSEAAGAAQAAGVQTQAGRSGLCQYQQTAGDGHVADEQQVLAGLVPVVVKHQRGQQ